MLDRKRPALAIVAILTVALAGTAYGQEVAIIHTEKQSYGDNERVRIYGTVGPYMPGALVSVSVIAPDGRGLATMSIDVGALKDNSYFDDYYWDKYFEDHHGVYTARVQYLDTSSTTQFTIGGPSGGLVKTPPWIR